MLAKKALANGQCVVIGMQSTSESDLNRAIESKQGKISEFISTMEYQLVGFIKRNMDTGDSLPLQKRKEELISDCDTITWPPAPLDDLIDRLGGPSKVAEMTGFCLNTIFQ